MDPGRERSESVRSGFVLENDGAGFRNDPCGPRYAEFVGVDLLGIDFSMDCDVCSFEGCFQIVEEFGRYVSSFY